MEAILNFLLFIAILAVISWNLPMPAMLRGESEGSFLFDALSMLLYLVPSTCFGTFLGGVFLAMSLNSFGFLQICQAGGFLEVFALFAMMFCLTIALIFSTTVGKIAVKTIYTLKGRSPKRFILEMIPFCLLTLGLSLLAALHIISNK